MKIKHENRSPNIYFFITSIPMLDGISIDPNRIQQGIASILAYDLQDAIIEAGKQAQDGKISVKHVMTTPLAHFINIAEPFFEQGELKPIEISKDIIPKVELSQTDQPIPKVELSQAEKKRNEKQLVQLLESYGWTCKKKKTIKKGKI